MNRKGNIRDVGLAMVFVFIATVMFFVVTFAYNDVVDKLVNNTVINSSHDAVQSFEKSRDLTGRLDYVVFILLIGFTLGILITGWLVGGHPIFAFIYFIALTVLVAAAGVLSFVWNELSTKAIFGNLANSTFPISNFIIGNFPVYIAIIGFLGMMVAFAKPRQEGFK